MATMFWLAAVVLAQGPQSAERPRMRELGQQMSHGEGRLRPGDLAPDFDLKKVRSEERVRLSQLRGKLPVALVFGSYT